MIIQLTTYLVLLMDQLDNLIKRVKLAIYADSLPVVFNTISKDLTSSYFLYEVLLMKENIGYMIQQVFPSIGNTFVSQKFQKKRLDGDKQVFIW